MNGLNEEICAALPPFHLRPLLRIDHAFALMPGGVEYTLWSADEANPYYVCCLSGEAFVSGVRNYSMNAAIVAVCLRAPLK